MHQVLKVDGFEQHGNVQPPLFRELTVDETDYVAGGPGPAAAIAVTAAREAGKAAVAAAVGAYVGAKMGGNKGGNTTVITNVDCRPG